MIRLFDYIFFLRPTLFFPAWSTLLILHGSLGFDISILTFIGSGFVMGSCFIINQIEDIETDKINEKCFFINENRISIKLSYIYVAFSLSVGLLAIYAVNNFKFYISIVFFVITGIMYNVKPFKFKQNMVLGALSNYVMGFLISLLAFSRFEGIKFDEVLVLSIYNFVIYILTTLPDIEGDYKTGKKTIGNVFNLRGSLTICLLLVLINFLFSQRSESEIYFILNFILFIQIVLQLIIKKNIVIMIIKVSLIIQSIVAMIYYPIYLVPVLLMYFGGRLYYKTQFNLDYPSLKNE